MRRILLLVGLLVVQLMFAVCAAQNISRNASATDSVPYGLKTQEWNKMQEIWAKKNRPVNVLLSDGNSLQGHILYLYNDTLVLHYKGLTFINQYVAGNEIIRLHRDSLISISYSPELTQRLMRSGLFWMTMAGISAGVGLFWAGGGWIHPVIIAIPILAGAGIGGYIDFKNNSKATEPLFLDLRARERREKYVMFPDQLPGISGIGEYSPFIVSKIFATANFDDLINASPRVRRIFGTPVISLAGQTGWTSIAKGSNIRFGWNSGFSFTYRPLTKLKIGYHRQNITTFGKPLYEYFDGRSGLTFYEDGQIVSHNLFVKYVPVTSSPFLTSRFEVSAGIGTSFNKLQHNSHIRYYDWQILAGTDISTASKNIGLIFLSDIDYFLTRELSLFLSINKSISKPFKTKDLSAVHPVTSEDIFYETMEVYPSPIDILLGLRIHLLRR